MNRVDGHIVRVHLVVTLVTGEGFVITGLGHFHAIDIERKVAVANHSIGNRHCINRTHMEIDV